MTNPIDEQVFNHLISLLDGWQVWYDYYHDDQASTSNQFLIRSTGGSEDGHTGRPTFDLVAIGATQDTSVPKTLLESVSAYLLTNYTIDDIINVIIVSGARPAGMLSNNRPVYSMTINLLTERNEVP